MQVTETDERRNCSNATCLCFVNMVLRTIIRWSLSVKQREEKKIRIELDKMRCHRETFYNVYIVHIVYFHSITHFLNQQLHNFYLLHNAIFTVKSDQHVSDPYSGTIIRDPYCESHKITNQQIMVNIKSSKGKM
jgi:hypothetical protein